MAKEIKDVSRPQQEEMHITTEKVYNQCRKIPNWKAPGPDGIHGFWLKKLASISSNDCRTTRKDS